MSQSDNRKARRAAQRRVEKAADEIGAAPESVEEAKRIVDEAYDRRAEPQGTPDLPAHHPAMGNLTDEEMEESGYDGPMVTEEPHDTPDVEIVLPPLMSGSDLMPPEPEEIPPEPQMSGVLPGERHGPFIVQKDRDLIITGDLVEPVGVWAAREHPTLSGPDLASVLIEAGLPQKRAVYYGRLRASPPEVEIPPDIEAVWGGGRLDGTGMPAINTARVMIDKHGVEGFRKSALHQAALAEIDHFKQKDAFSRAFVAAQNKKGAK